MHLSPSYMAGCSNCTFMELKSVCAAFPPPRHPVLIVPLWNWNHHLTEGKRTGPRVLIVPLWNWNSEEEGKRTLRVSSNCTFMELKLVWLWFLRLVSCRSNCTFMELKFIFPADWNSPVLSSNCTFMELKSRCRLLPFLRRSGSNCTFMELKSRCSLLPFLRRSVLIVPLWNWNSSRAKRPQQTSRF